MNKIYIKKTRVPRQTFEGTPITLSYIEREIIKECFSQLIDSEPTLKELKKDLATIHVVDPSDKENTILQLHNKITTLSEVEMLERSNELLVICEINILSKIKEMKDLLEQASRLVGSPIVNISGSTDVACQNWQHEYQKFKLKDEEL